MSTNDVPDLSFGFIKKPPHVITGGEILYLSLDLWPGPYQSVPEVIPEAGPPRGT